MKGKQGMGLLCVETRTLEEGVEILGAHHLHEFKYFQVANLLP